MAQTNVLREFTRGRHRHSACIAVALNTAESACHRQGHRLTKMRRRVLELVWGSHEPVKAYDLLELLRGENKRAAPPTVYRALDFLQQQGLVHRIESRNAYVGCGCPGHEGAGQLLICRACGQVAELDDKDIIDLIARKSARLGFEISRQTIEVEGRCAGCREQQSS
jgi:Fur family zinc uptake transcriptional regulator